MQMVRRFPAPLLAATLALLAAELVIRLLGSRIPEPLRWDSWEAQNKVAQMDARAAGEIGTDLVFVGSSVVNTGFDPAPIRSRTGLSVFNAALNGADMRATDWWTTRVVLPRLRPQRVVIGVSSMEFINLDPWPDNLYRRLVGSDAGREMTGAGSTSDRIEAIVERSSSLFRHRSVLRRPTTALGGMDNEQRIHAVRLDGSLVALENVERPYGMDAATRQRWRKFQNTPYIVDRGQIAAFDHLVRTLRKQRIDVTVVLMPVTRDVVPWHQLGATDYAEFLAAITAFVDEHRLSFVDAGTATDGRGAFLDPIHLNTTGRRYLSQAITPLVAADPEPAPSAAPDVDAPDKASPQPADADVPSAPEAPDGDVPEGPALPSGPQKTSIPPPGV